jgi:hypothetical protein
MTRQLTRTALLVAFTLAVVSVSTEARAQWGNLKGKFIYAGSPPATIKITPDKDVEVCGKHELVNEELLVGKDGGIANVLIYVRLARGAEIKTHPDYEKTANDKIEYDNKGCRFNPHILPIRLTQTLVLHNSDACGHNSNLQPLGDEPVNPLLPAGGAFEYKFSKPQTVPQGVSCNIHPWMKGHILPLSHPYAAVSAPDGSFEIKNLPEGEWEFQVWHEKSGYLAIPGWDRGRFKLSIKSGENVLGDGIVKVDPSVFQK